MVYSGYVNLNRCAVPTCSTRSKLKLWLIVTLPCYDRSTSNELKYIQRRYGRKELILLILRLVVFIYLFLCLFTYLLIYFIFMSHNTCRHVSFMWMYVIFTRIGDRSIFYYTDQFRITFCIDLSSFVRILFLCSTYTPQFLKYFGEILYIYVFWLIEECYWIWFESDYFFVRFQYNDLF